MEFEKSAGAAPKEEVQKEQFSSQGQAQQDGPGRDEATQNPFMVARAKRTHVRSNVSEKVRALVEVLNKQSDEIVMDENPLGIRFTAVSDEAISPMPMLIAYNTKGRKDGGMAYFTFMIEEGLPEALHPYTRNIGNGQPVEIYRDNCDYWDKRLTTRLTDFVRRQTRASGKVRNAHFQLVKPHVDLENPENAAILYVNADRALRSFLLGDHINLESFLKYGAPIDVRHDVHPGGTVADLEGNPVFTDVSVITSVTDPTTVNQNKNTSENDRELTITLATAECFLDATYDPSRQALQIGPNDMAFPIWHPMIVIGNTRATSQTGESYETFDSVAFAIPGALELLDKGPSGKPNWTQIYLRNAGGRPDMGVLTYIDDGFPGHLSPTPKKTEIDYTPRRPGRGIAEDGSVGFDDFLAHNFYDDIVLAIDYQPGARNAWLMKPFFDSVAADDPKVRAAANLRLFESFNNATCGELQKIMTPEESIMQPVIYAVNTGWFKDPDDNVHDIREYTIWHYAEKLKADAATRIADFQGIFAPGGCSQDQGLINIQNRRLVLQSLLKENPEFHMELGHRLMFSGNFLEKVSIAFAKAHEKHNLAPRSEGLVTVSSNQPMGVGYKSTTFHGATIFTQRGNVPYGNGYNYYAGNGYRGGFRG